MRPVDAEQHRTGRLRRTLPNLVSLIQETGSLVLAEGIETRDQALLAMDADVDFVQGFYFARPSQAIDPEQVDRLSMLGEITHHFETAINVEERLEADRINPYSDAFREAIERIDRGEHPRQATHSLMAMPLMARFYILDDRGEESMHLDGRPQGNRQLNHAGPIADTSGGTWYRRQYFRSAMAEPQRLQTSRPYLSSSGAYMCVTLSMACGQPPAQVICCDIHC